MAESVYGIMRRTRFRNLGTTALHLAYVAKGAMIGCVTTVTKIWDIAAGAFIVETAGGMVTDLSGKSVLEMNLDNYAGGNYAVLAANKKNHAELLKVFGG